MPCPCFHLGSAVPYRRLILVLVLLAGCATTPDDAEAPATAVPHEMPEQVVVVSFSGDCTTATWHDPSLFQMALHLDAGNRSSDHLVEPGLHYVAPRPGLSLPNGPGLPYPHSIRSITSGHLEDSITLSAGHEPKLRVIARDEDEARQRARVYLEE